MADRGAKQDAENLKEKLKSLKNLITSLQDQTKELQCKKASRAGMQTKKSDFPGTYSPLHQKQFQIVKGMPSSEMIQDRKRIGSDMSKRDLVRSKDIRNVHEFVGSSNSVSMPVNQNSEPNELNRKEGQSSIDTLGTPQAGESVNKRLSRLAKEVWNKRTEKFNKMRSHNSSSQTSKGIKKPGKELLIEDHPHAVSSTYKLNNVQNHVVKRRFAKASKALLDVNYPTHQNPLIESHNTEDGCMKGIKQKSVGRLVKNSKSSYSKPNTNSSETQSKTFNVGKNSSNPRVLGENNIENDSLHKSSSLANSSDRLSALAKQTWKTSVAAKAFNKGNFKGWIKSDQRAANSMWQVSHNKNLRSRGLNFSLKEASRINCPGSELSTDDRLSNLAKNIWQKQTKLMRPFGNHTMHSTSSRTRPVKYQMSFSKSQDIFNQPSYKFNWISKEKRVTSFLYRRRRAVLKKSRFKIIRDSSVMKSIPNQGRTKKSTNRSITHRVIYYIRAHSKSKESNVLFTNLRGKKFVTDTKGRRLIRLSLSSSHPPRGPKLNEDRQRNSLLLPARRRSSVYLTPTRYKIVRRHSLNQTASPKIVKANRMLKKSVFRIHRQNTRKFVKKDKQYCMFFNRFGKCKNGAKCHYIHDPEKVAVCTRFLRGTCKDNTCLFSHKIDRQKMPTCQFFLNGVCHRENCPYSHVKVSGTAEICKDFLKGYCPSGDKCLKRHMLECEEFSMRGSCPDGDKCKLYHRKRRLKRRRSSSISGTKTPKPFSKKVKLRRKSNEVVDLKNATENDFKIRPSLTSVENPDGGTVGMTRLKRKRRFDWKREAED